MISKLYANDMKLQIFEDIKSLPQFFFAVSVNL